MQFINKEPQQVDILPQQQVVQLIHWNDMSRQMKANMIPAISKTKNRLRQPNSFLQRIIFWVLLKNPEPQQSNCQSAFCKNWFCGSTDRCGNWNEKCPTVDEHPRICVWRWTPVCVLPLCHQQGRLSALRPRGNAKRWVWGGGVRALRRRQQWQRQWWQGDPFGPLSTA